MWAPVSAAVDSPEGGVEHAACDAYRAAHARCPGRAAPRVTSTGGLGASLDGRISAPAQPAPFLGDACVALAVVESEGSRIPMTMKTRKGAVVTSGMLSTSLQDAGGKKMLGLPMPSTMSEKSQTRSALPHFLGSKA